MTDKKDLYYIDKVLAGKTDAFAWLVNKYKDMVFTLSVNLLQNRELAEEVSQDVFLKVYNSLSKFQKKAKFSTWLYRIAYNECISSLRKKKNDTVSIESINNSQFINIAGEEREWENTEVKKIKLNKAIQNLNKSEKTIILMHYFEELSIDEISKITELSKSNVKIKLFRARKKLYSNLIKYTEVEFVNE